MSLWELKFKYSLPEAGRQTGGRKHKIHIECLSPVEVSNLILFKKVGADCHASHSQPFSIF